MTLQTTASTWQERLRCSIYSHPSLDPEAEIRSRALRRVATQLRHSLELNPPSLEEQFVAATREWQEATRFSSDLSEAVFHPAYQRIIGMGEPVLPLIIRELQCRPHWWFYALHTITGIDPTAEEDAGSLSKLSRSWVEWAEREGIRWQP